MDIEEITTARPTERRRWTTLSLLRTIRGSSPVLRGTLIQADRITLAQGERVLAVSRTRPRHHTHVALGLRPRGELWPRHTAWMTGLEPILTLDQCDAIGLDQRAA